MLKYFSLFIVLLFSGCSYTYENFKDGYKAAKVVYKDVRYVVYEVKNEKKSLEKKDSIAQQ